MESLGQIVPTKKKGWFGIQGDQGSEQSSSFQIGLDGGLQKGPLFHECSKM